MKRMETDDFELVQRARSGDALAFRELVDRYSRPLFKVAFRVVRDEAGAEDAVQETFLRAYRKLHRFDGRSKLFTWLYRIAVNCSLDVMRREKRFDAYTPTEPAALDGAVSAEPGPDRIAESGEIGRRVASVLDGLSAKERTAFVLRHFEGRSIAEIGRLLGTRENATKQAVFRAVRKLRAALSPLIEESHEAVV